MPISNLTITKEGTGGVLGIVPLTLSTQPSPSTPATLSPSGASTPRPKHPAGLNALGGGGFVILCILAFLLWRKYWERKPAVAAGKKDGTVDGLQAYLQQKSELEAEERGKYELEAEERRYEITGDIIHEMSDELARRENARTKTQELKGEEFSKELHG